MALMLKRRSTSRNPSQPRVLNAKLKSEQNYRRTDTGLTHSPNKNSLAIGSPVTKLFIKKPSQSEKVKTCKIRNTEKKQINRKRKQSRYRPGHRALMEIRLFQKTTGCLIKKLPFQRLVKEITHAIKEGFKMQAQAIMALQVILLFHHVFNLIKHNR